MYWIVENNLFKEPFYDKLLPFLDKMEIPYETNRVIPFGGGFLEEPKPTEENIIVIGSYSMTVEAIDRGWVPGAFTNDNYDYRVWSKEWEGKCLNAPATISKFGEVAEITDHSFTINVKRPETSKIAAEILKKFDVDDLDINEPKLEDIVREIFEESKS